MDQNTPQTSPVTQSTVTAVPLTPSPVVDLTAAQSMTATPARVEDHATADPLVGHLNDPDWMDVAKATWMKETIVGQLTMSAAANAAVDPSEPLVDPTFNPNRFVRESGQFDDLQQEIANGWFASAETEPQFRRLAQVARWNKDAREQIARGDGGNLAANMGASLLDVTSLLSAGALVRAGRGASLLARAGTGAAVGAADAAGQELVLQSNDATRTKEEAFMNIGSTMFLGAGLGAIFKGVPHDSPLMPGHPLNPLRDENLGNVTLHEHAPGKLPGEGATVSNAGDNIGAMQAGGRWDEDLGRFVYPDSKGRLTDADAGIAKGKGLIGRAADRLFSLGGFTPLQRATHYDGPGMSAIISLNDTGGLMTEAMARGVAHTPEAETLKTLYTQKAQFAARNIHSIFNKANADLGQSSAGTTLRSAASVMSLGRVELNKVGQKQFFAGVRDHLAGLMTGDAQSAEKIVKGLMDSGFTEQAAKQLHGRMTEAAAQQIKLYDDFWNEAVRIGLADPKIAAKAGRYGGPTLFNKKAIDNNPMHFQSIVLEHIRDKPVDEWLIANGHIADPTSTKPLAEGEKPLPKSWDEIKASGDTAKINEVIRDWSGEVEMQRDSIIEQKHAAALKRLADAKDAANDAASEFSTVDKGYQKLKLKEIEAKAKTVEMGIHSRNIAAATNAAEKAEAKVNAILAKHPDPYGLADDLRAQMEADGHSLDLKSAKVREAEKPLGEAESLVAALKGDKAPLTGERAALEGNGHWTATRDRAAVQEQIDKVNQELREAYAERAKAREEHAQAMADFNATAQQQRNTADWRAAVEKEAAALAKHDPEGQLAPGLRERLRADQDRLEVLQDNLRDVRDARQRALALRKQLRKELTSANKEVDGAAWESRKAAWGYNKAAKRTPAAAYAEKLANHLRGNDRPPAGLLLDKAPTTGRLKERQFDWSPEQFKELMDHQFVETDPMHMMDRYANDMGGQIALHKAFDGKGKEEVMREIQEHYDAKLAVAKTDKEKARINETRRANLADVQAGFDRIMGHMDSKDDNGVAWAADKLRHATLLRYQGGFIFGALGDLATAAFAAKGSVLKLLSTKGMREYGELMRLASKGDKGGEELTMILGSLEHAAHMQMSERALGNGSGRDVAGFGSGLTRDVTGKIDKLLSATSDTVNRASLLKGYSDAVRRAAGLVQLANLRKMVGGFEKLSVSQKADLAKLGIGDWEAKHLAKFFADHGSSTDSGLFIPNMGAWLDKPHGAEMSDVLSAALLKAQKRASYTSGFGNAPLLMDKWYGKMFLQFQSYAFQYGNNFLRAGFQHGAVTGDHMKFAQAMGLAMAAGVLTTAIATFRKEGLEGVNKMSENPAALGYQVIQRSGLLAYAGSYSDAGVKLLGPTIQSSTGIALDTGAGKYSQNSALANLAGPWLGTLDTVSGIGADAARGDLTQLQKKARSLIPMDQQVRILQRMFGSDPNQ